MSREAGPVQRVWFLMVLTTLMLLGRQGLAAEEVSPVSDDANETPAEGAPQAPGADPQTPSVEIPNETYLPPRWGVPRAKVGGGLRYGRQSPLPTPLTLAPAQLARTVSASPTLFWYIDTVLNPGVKPVFYLTDYSRSEPVAEIPLMTPERRGIQRIDLVEHGIELEIEIEYDWAIALVVDPQQRSRDIVANAYIQRVSPPPSISEESCSFETCIELGLWYDALETISNAIDAAPQNSALRARRDALLREVGLGAAVDERAQQAR